MKLLFKEKLFSRSWFINHSLIIIGSFIMAAGYVFFITPHRIVPGGVYGISIIIDLGEYRPGGRRRTALGYFRRRPDRVRAGTHFPGQGHYRGIRYHRQDPCQIYQDAFVTVVDAKEVLGEGFKSLNEV